VGAGNSELPRIGTYKAHAIRINGDRAGAPARGIQWQTYGAPIGIIALAFDQAVMVVGSFVGNIVDRQAGVVDRPIRIFYNCGCIHYVSS